MTIEKVYDELYGMIDDLKKQIAAGGGGDSVTITPALESGAKVADYTIGSDDGALFAPLPFSFETAERVEGTFFGATVYSKSVHVPFTDFTVDGDKTAHVTLASYYPEDVDKKLFIDGIVYTPSTGNIQIGKKAYISAAAPDEYMEVGIYYTQLVLLNINSTQGNTLATVGPTSLDAKIYYTKQTANETKKTRKK